MHLGDEKFAHEFEDAARVFLFEVLIFHGAVEDSADFLVQDWSCLVLEDAVELLEGSEKIVVNLEHLLELFSRGRVNLFFSLFEFHLLQVLSLVEVPQRQRLVDGVEDPFQLFAELGDEL